VFTFMDTIDYAAVDHAMRSEREIEEEDDLGTMPKMGIPSGGTMPKMGIPPAQNGHTFTESTSKITTKNSHPPATVAPKTANRTMKRKSFQPPTGPEKTQRSGGERRV
jgi:hypothetical protein